ITGLSTALRLAQAGERVAVLEARRVGSSNTGGSTGNLYATVALGLSAIHAKWDQETVNRVVGLRRRAIEAIEDNVRRLEIDCQFERVLRHWCVEDFARESAEDYREQLERELSISEAAGLRARLLTEPEGLGMALRLALMI